VQQPLDAIRSYFGAKLAFYHAWIEAYTCWLLLLMWGAAAVQGCTTITGLGGAISVTVYAVLLALAVTAFNAYWRYRNAGLAYAWDVVDFREEV